MHQNDGIGRHTRFRF